MRRRGPGLLLPDPAASRRLNNPFLPQTSRLQPKRDPSPVSGECGALTADVPGTRGKQGTGPASAPVGRVSSREPAPGRERGLGS